MIKLILISINFKHFFVYYYVEVKCRNRIFQVYTLKEAKELGIEPIKNWRDGKEGDWITTFDEKVLQVISRRTKKEKGRKPVDIIRIGYGEVPCYKKHIYAFKYPDNNYDSMHRYSLIRDLKPTALQVEFATKLAKHGKLDKQGDFTKESVVETYQTVYSDNNPNTSLNRARTILSKKSVRRMMSELMKDRLEAIGVDDDYIANEYKEFLENKKIPPNVRLNALNRVSALRGHDDKKIESLEGSTMIQLEDGDKKLLAVARKMLSADEIDKFLEQGEINGINKRESSKKGKNRNKSRH